MLKENIGYGTRYAATWLKILAFLFPLFVIYGPVNDDMENRANQLLWGYILVGLMTEISLLLLLAFHL